jgi:hypothetical protein
LIRFDEYPQLCSTVRWDAMSVGTCPVTLPWSSKWTDAVAHLRSKKIVRLLAWGDSTGGGRCRVEYADQSVTVAGTGGSDLTEWASSLFSSVVKPIAERHAQLFSGEQSFFTYGRKRFDFNASIDLRADICVQIVVHASASCGTVYTLTLLPDATSRIALQSVTPAALVPPVGGEHVDDVVLRQRAKPLSGKREGAT